MGTITAPFQAIGGAVSGLDQGFKNAVGNIGGIGSLSQNTVSNIAGAVGTALGDVGKAVSKWLIIAGIVLMIFILADQLLRGDNAPSA